MDIRKNVLRARDYEALEMYVMELLMRRLIMKILAFGAHPDDIEFLCAGTLAKYRKAGHQVGIVISTNGEVGSPNLSKEEISKIRESEAREFCRENRC